MNYLKLADSSIQCELIVIQTKAWAAADGVDWRPW